MTEKTKGAPRPTTGEKTLRHAMALIRREAWKQQALAARATAQTATYTRWNLRMAPMQEGGAQ